MKQACDGPWHDQPVLDPEKVEAMKNSGKLEKRR